jgi:cell wall-associated NlpC family hydrolase
MTTARPARLVDWRTVEAVLRDLPGHPYRRGGRGPEAFDCWGLVLEVRRRLALALPPDIASGALTRDQIVELFHATRPEGWRRIEPALGAIVLAEDAAHAGVLVANRVLHTQARAGVVAWTLGHWAANFGALDCWDIPRDSVKGLARG